MADPRESFPVLVDGNNEGVDLRAIVEGDSPVGKNGLLGFSFKDSAGNAILPQLTAEGAIPVDSSGTGTPHFARGVKLSGTQTVGVVADIVSETVPVSMNFKDFAITVSCRRAAIFQLVQVDDATTTILLDVVLDAGQYTFQAHHANIFASSGATGTQAIKIQGYTLDKASDLRATLSFLETV